MSAVEALRLAHSSGIRIGVVGTDLVLDADQVPAPHVLKAVREHKQAIIAMLAVEGSGWTTRDWLAFHDKHVRIGMSDFGRPRSEAEVQAFESCIVEWLNRHPVHSDHDRCLACGCPDREEHAVVPFGTEKCGHAWLHPECWTDWHASRKAQAILALAGIGIEPPANFPDDFGKSGRK